MKKIALLFFILLTNFSAANELTIAEAISLSKKNRPNIQALEYKIREEKLKVKEAWTGYLPQLQLTSSYDKISSLTPGKSGPEGLSAGVQAQQLVYQFGGPQQQAKVAQFGVNVAESDKETQEAQLAYEVTKNFIDAWVIQQQKTLFEQLELSSKRLFNRSKKEHSAALADKHDFFSSVETRATAHEQISSFEEDAKLAADQLTFLLGKKEKIHLLDTNSAKKTILLFTPQANPQSKEFNNSQEYIAYALKHRPEIKLINHRIGLEQETVKLEKLSNAPKISLYGSAGHTGTLSAAGQIDQCAAGISFSWPVFDGTRSHYRQQEADARATAAILQKEHLIQQITFEVEQAYRLTSKATITHHTQRIALKRAEALFAKRIREQKLGIITQTSLEEARYAMLQTKNRLLLAQADVAQKEALLKFRTGQLERE